MLFNLATIKKKVKQDDVTRRSRWLLGFGFSGSLPLPLRVVSLPGIGARRGAKDRAP
jgi:hypothetical protein